MRKHLLIILLFIGCGGTTKPTATNLSIMAPLFALTSPVTGTSGTGPVYATILADVTSRAMTQTNSNQCYADIDATPVFYELVSFGPTIGYDNHPNGAATNSGAEGCPTGASGCLSRGDVGAWVNNETTTGEASMVAHSNYMANDIGYIINNSLKYTAGTVCAAQLGGTAMPAIGGSTDVTKIAQDASLTGTVTSARVGRLADLGDGKNTYTVSTNFSVGTAIRYNINVIHSTSTDKTAFKGRIYGYVDIDYSKYLSSIPAGFNLLTTKDRKVFSAIYDFQGGVLKIKYEGILVPQTVSSSSFLDSSGNMSYTNFLTGTYPDYRDTRTMLNSITVATGVGTAYYGWQGKPTENYARLLKIQAGATTGFSYFGFSAKPGAAGYGVTLGGMFCNWAGPAASLGAYQTTNVQSQTLTLTAGVFGSTINRITYAPTNTCNTTGGTFKYGTSSSYAGAAVGPTVTNNFVTQTANGTITVITAPTYP